MTTTGFRVRREAYSLLALGHAVGVTFVLHHPLASLVQVLDEVAFLEIDEFEERTGRERRGEVVRVESRTMGQTWIRVNCPEAAP